MQVLHTTTHEASTIPIYNVFTIPVYNVFTIPIYIHFDVHFYVVRPPSKTPPRMTMRWSAGDGSSRRQRLRSGVLSWGEIDQDLAGHR